MKNETYDDLFIMVDCCRCHTWQFIFQQRHDVSTVLALLVAENMYVSFGSSLYGRFSKKGP